jgi:hypothetical protein
MRTHSSLIRYGNNYDHKRFYSTGPWLPGYVWPTKYLFLNLINRVGIQKTSFELLTITVGAGVPYSQGDVVFLSLSVVLKVPIP